MAKLKTNPIRENDLEEYLSGYSDFAFEVTVLNALIGLGFACAHGGSYVDPFTQKPREFDIRAVKVFEKRSLRLAVECKNLRDSFPLLVCRLPRRPEESYHEVVCSFDREQFYPAPDWNGGLTRYPPRYMRPQAKNLRFSETDSFYRPSEFVGKSVDQVGRDNSGSIVANDTEIYPKWSQAISSAQELVDHSVREAEERGECVLVSAVIPVLVIPDGMLWIVDYDSDGHKVAGPNQVNRCSYYVGMSYYGGDKFGGTDYHISHIELVTLAGLNQLVSDLAGDEDKLKTLFPLKRIDEALESSDSANG